MNKKTIITVLLALVATTTIVAQDLINLSFNFDCTIIP